MDRGASWGHKESNTSTNAVKIFTSEKTKIKDTFAKINVVMKKISNQPVLRNKNWKITCSFLKEMATIKMKNESMRISVGNVIQNHHY